MGVKPSIQITVKKYVNQILKVMYSIQSRGGHLCAIVEISLLTIGHVSRQLDKIKLKRYWQWRMQEQIKR